MDQEAKLTFGELELGDMFIILPVSGDNDGHGGFKVTHYIFQKIELGTWALGTYESRVMAKKLSTGKLVNISYSTEVIKVA